WSGGDLHGLRSSARMHPQPARTSPVIRARRRPARAQVRVARMVPSGPRIERVQVVDCVRDPLDELSRSVLRLHLGAVAGLTEGAGPPGQRGEQLLPVEAPGFVEVNL